MFYIFDKYCVYRFGLVELYFGCFGFIIIRGFDVYYEWKGKKIVFNNVGLFFYFIDWK